MIPTNVLLILTAAVASMAAVALPALPVPLHMATTTTIAVPQVLSVDVPSETWLSASNARIGTHTPETIFTSAMNVTIYVINATSTSGTYYEYAEVASGQSECAHGNETGAAAMYRANLMQEIGIMDTSSCSWVLESNSTVYNNVSALEFYSASCNVTDFPFAVTLYYAASDSKFLGGTGTGNISAGTTVLPGTLLISVTTWDETAPAASTWVIPSICFIDGMDENETSSAIAPQESTSTPAETSSTAVVYSQPPQLPAPLHLALTTTISVSIVSLEMKDEMWITTANARLDNRFPGVAVASKVAQNTTLIALSESGDQWNYTHVLGSTATCEHHSGVTYATAYQKILRSQLGVLALGDCLWIYTANGTKFSGTWVDTYYSPSCNVSSYTFAISLYYELGGSTFLGGAGSGAVTFMGAPLTATIKMTVNAWNETTPSSSVWTPPSPCSTTTTTSSSTVEAHGAASSLAASIVLIAAAISRLL